MKDQIHSDLKNIVPLLNRSFVDLLSISDHEFNHHFMDSGFPLSKMTLFVDR